jgi:hypothetical protein
MQFLNILSPGAIGPVWPVMLLYLAYMATTSVFLVLARFRSWLKTFTLREYRFLQRLYDATEMFSTLAILTGMIGTCLGLFDVLPALGNTLRIASENDRLAQVIGPLRNVWASTIAGLILGGLWGEILLFILKPYTRPALLPLSSEEPPANAADFDFPDQPLPENDPDNAREFEDDWRQHDREGMY